MTAGGLTGSPACDGTVSFDDLQGGVQRLVSCPHQVRPNAYYDA